MCGEEKVVRVGAEAKYQVSQQSCIRLINSTSKWIGKAYSMSDMVIQKVPMTIDPALRNLIVGLGMDDITPVTEMIRL